MTLELLQYKTLSTTKAMTYIEKCHLLKLCKKYDIDSREIDPSLNYWENKFYLEQFIPVTFIKEERENLTDLVREELNYNDKLSNLELFFKIAAKKAECSLVKFLLAELERNAEFIDVKLESVVWSAYNVRKELVSQSNKTSYHKEGTN